MKLKNYIKYIKINNENTVKEIFENEIKFKIENEIENKMKLEKMVIYKSDDNKKIITMEDFYKKLEEEKKVIFMDENYKVYKDKNPYNLKLGFDIEAKIFFKTYSVCFNIGVGNLYLEDILITPIKTKIKVKNEIKDIYIISFQQNNFCINKYGILIPNFKCNNCNKIDYSCPLEYIKHRN